MEQTGKRFAEYFQTITGNQAKIRDLGKLPQWDSKSREPRVHIGFDPDLRHHLI